MTGVFDTVNRMDEETFVATFGALYEHSQWIAQEVFDRRPFGDTDGLLSAFRQVVSEASEEKQLALVREHPELARRAGVDATLTKASQSEQASAGLDRLTPEEYAHFNVLNTAYRERFAMPFVICVRLSDKGLILSEMARRVKNTPAAELRMALAEIDKIAALRSADVLKRLEAGA
ncbi:2-oxo-4-hydroxy-4-carboxy-5-ureidoimidazoline decarboxylase [Acetobacter fallax]|uniref:2-oxo-4-hydroxy-4-carboxy-5-ureidoimidazoline decarboxylase n=1 Tax=Acetobacter fallax TaxID=1737473 RepID=A0ABX0K6K8_9PROT|nr:2-oxo-4-hydroxy-4-carboxy-5-ureidoimidazoline decarboxylase [Acetobacter fallax]NHO31094.1 2-oxo-4-hydroxy-4-carboxy-5-ureidoimidazoline decarboxylase [Acetobacter fallax]NHO34651.1 2-oxo-4-hydroxy-4-carboxy-5-ureidoimidazoline decarboxylase [Acetobacter fallax]